MNNAEEAKKQCNACYCSYRLRLEKLKQNTWILIVFAKLLHFLIVLISLS